jgi:hypothetical protein
MCTIDWAAQDKLATLIMVHLDEKACVFPLPIADIRGVLKGHHKPDSPCSLLFSAHSSCDPVTKLHYFRSLVMAPWYLNGTRPEIIEEDGSFESVDRHLCAMVEAAVFIQGSDSTSYLAERIRRLRKRSTVTELASSAHVAWLEAERENSLKIIRAMNVENEISKKLATASTTPSRQLDHRHRMDFRSGK